MKYLFKPLIFSLIILISPTASAQKWTWINGDSIPNQTGIYQSADDENIKPGARLNGTTWTDNDGNLWLFGGLGYAISNMGQLSDLWKYDPQINRWKWINGSSSTYQTGNYVHQGTFSPVAFPGARTNAISWTDHAGKLWLYGGMGFVNGFSVMFSDLWQFDPVSGMWVWWKGTWSEDADYGILNSASPANTPGERSGSSSWTDNAGNLWLFGGNTATNMKSDLWKYTPSTNQWTWVNGSNLDDQSGTYGFQGTPSTTSSPGARSHTFCFKDKDNHFYLFGGYGNANGSNPGHLNDLWKYDPLTNTWVWLKGAHFIDQIGTYGIQGTGNQLNTPGGRMHISGWIDLDGSIWVFGGMGYASTNSGMGAERLNDLWKYDLLSNQWTWIKGSDTYNSLSVYGERLVPDFPNTPGARSNFMNWSNERGLWLFGGNGFPGSSQQTFGQQNDLWRFGSDTLTFINPPEVISETIELPNVFSPNEDGINDLLEIKKMPPFDIYEFTICNRWGQIVFRSSDPAENWDGTSGGQKCTEGVYFYRLELQNTAGKAYRSSGFISLIR